MHMPKCMPTRLGTGCLPDGGKSVPLFLFLLCLVVLTHSSPYTAGQGICTIARMIATRIRQHRTSVDVIPTRAECSVTS